MPAPTPPSHRHIHVVLVEPGDSLNVGAVARAMSNLDFAHLHMVAPPRYNPQRAAITACWAADRLAAISQHSTLAEALVDMEHVVGFSARQGRNRPRELTLSQWAGRLRAEPPRQTALLFGCEDSGLRREHLAHCHWLVRIPSSAANPSFNLAQSVLLALFELSRPSSQNPPSPSSPPQSPEQTDLRPWANARQFAQLDSLVEEVLTRCRFYKDGTPAPLPGVISHLLRRIDPDAREMRVLLGMFGKINRTLSGKVPLGIPHKTHDLD